MTRGYGNHPIPPSYYTPPWSHRYVNSNEERRFWGGVQYWGGQVFFSLNESFPITLAVQKATWCMTKVEFWETNWPIISGCSWFLLLKTRMHTHIYKCSHGGDIFKKFLIPSKIDLKPNEISSNFIKFHPTSNLCPSPIPKCHSDRNSPQFPQARPRLGGLAGPVPRGRWQMGLRFSTFDLLGGNACTNNIIYIYIMIFNMI